MNRGLIKIDQTNIDPIQEPQKAKCSKAQIQAKFHKIPAFPFEDQKITSFLGMLIFQPAFKRRNLEQRFKKNALITWKSSP